MKFLTKFFLTVMMVVAGNVYASELSDAKAAGLVGEQYTGYLAVVKNSTPAIEQLVADVNAQRKAAYQNVADKRKTSLESVELVAGESAIEKTLPGNYIKRKGEGWTKK
jgi:uncharacterized protein